MERADLAKLCPCLGDTEIMPGVEEVQRNASVQPPFTAFVVN